MPVFNPDNELPPSCSPCALSLSLVALQFSLLGRTWQDYSDYYLPLSIVFFTQIVHLSYAKCTQTAISWIGRDFPFICILISTLSLRSYV
jgi:hypothetical protein